MAKPTPLPLRLATSLHRTLYKAGIGRRMLGAPVLILTTRGRRSGRPIETPLIYFEEGAGTMQIGDHSVEIGAGMTVYIPEGTPHSFVPSGSRAMRALQFYAPSGPEQRFRGMAAP